MSSPSTSSAICANCQTTTFEKVNRNYRRFSVKVLCNPDTFQKVFGKVITPLEHRTQFLCSQCKDTLVSLTVRKSKRRGSLKRTFPTVKLTPKTAKRPKTNWKTRVKNLIDASKYELAFRCLLNESRKARMAFGKVCVQQIKQEAGVVTRNKTRQKQDAGIFNGNLTLERIQKFAWKDLIEEASSKMPLLVSVLQASFPARVKRVGDNIGDRRLGLILSIIFFTRAARTHNFVQAILGVELWRQGCSPKAFQTLNRLGITQGLQTARSHVDRIAAEHDSCLVKWRTSVEVFQGRLETSGQATMNTTNCLWCMSPFERHSRGLKRYSINNCGLTPHDFNGHDGFICFDCHSKLKKKTTPKRRAPKRVISTPVARTHKQPRICKKVVTTAIKDSKYGAAFNAILKSPSARRALRKYLKKSVQREIKSFPRTTCLSKQANVDNIRVFSWMKVVEESSRHMPLLVQVLRSVLPDPERWHEDEMFCGKKAESPEDVKHISDMRLGFILSLILYSRHWNVFNFIQGCISVQLWKDGSSWKGIKCLNNLGICKSKTGTVSIIDAVKKDAMSRQQQWQLEFMESVQASGLF